MNGVVDATISLNFEQIKVTDLKYDKDNQSKGNVEYTWKFEVGAA